MYGWMEEKKEGRQEILPVWMSGSGFRMVPVADGF